MLIRGRTFRLPGHKEARCICGSVIFSTNTNFTSQYLSRAWTQHQQTLLEHRVCLVTIPVSCLDTAPVTVPVSCVDTAYRYIPYSRRCCRDVLIRGRTSRLPGHKEARCIRGSVIFSTNTNLTSQYLSRAWTQHQQTPLEHRVCLVTVPVSCLDTAPVVCLVTVSVLCLDTAPVTVPVSCVDTAYRYIPYSWRCCRGVLIRGRTSRLPGHKEARCIRRSVIFSTNTNFIHCTCLVLGHSNSKPPSSTGFA